MADLEILKQVREAEHSLPWTALDAFMQHGTETGDEVAALAHGLDAIAAGFREQAELYRNAKLKGALSAHVVPLTSAAHEVGKVAAVLRQPRPGALTNRVLRADPAKGERPGDFATAASIGKADATGTPQGLDALIADAVAEGRGGLRPGETFTDAVKRYGAEMPDSPRSIVVDPPGTTQSDVAAYLSGESDDLPGLREALVPSSVRDQTEPADEPVTEEASDVQPLPSTATPADHPALRPTGQLGEIRAALPPVPLLGQPGDGGVGYDPLYIPPGGVPFTFANLMTPTPAASLPPHVSHSQMDTIGECGAKYRLQRVDGVTQIPQWALIGGNAFHAAVESWERMAAEHPGISLNEEDCDGAWRHWFGAHIAQIEESSPVPRALWRASKKGAEGETWWNANGPEMLRKYLAARPDEPSLMTGMAAKPAIEWEVSAPVPTGYGAVPFTAILDRVTWDERQGAYIIRDYKTGDRMPDGPEQLAEQAWTMILAKEAFGDRKFLGTFYNARKGTWTAPVDLLAEYSYEWFVYRVTAAHAQKLALTSGPTPARKTSFCGGCSVRWACPVGGPKR